MTLSRSSVQTGISMQFGLCFVIICLGVITAQAQEVVKISGEVTRSATETTVVDRVRLLEGELERQNTRLEQLQKTIDEQQLAIQTLLAKLSPGKAPSLDASANAVATTTTVSPDKADTSEPKNPDLEQRLARVEGQVLRVGPLRLSGDFRLRMDESFRSATNPPDPPLTHLQNV